MGAGRPKKKKIVINTDSLQFLLQEIYNDTQSIQKKARADIEERKGIKVNNPVDANLIGKINNESLKIIDSAVDKKLSLAKLQAQLLSSEPQDDKSKPNGGGFLSEEDKKLMRELVSNQAKKNNVTYDTE